MSWAAGVGVGSRLLDEVVREVGAAPGVVYCCSVMHGAAVACPDHLRARMTAENAVLRLLTR
jgi:hypothetical protein